MEQEMTPEPLNGRIKFHLTNLPPEVVQEIATVLPVASAACLALTSHSMAAILGTQYWKFHSRNDKNDFLACLEQDLPQYRHCLTCAMFHPAAGRRTHKGCISLREKSTSEEECKKADGNVDLSDGYVIQYRDVQLALNRHRYGSQHGIGLDAFAYREMEGPLIYYHERLFIRAKIVNNELLLRIQLTTPTHIWSTHRWSNNPNAYCPHTYENRHNPQSVKGFLPGVLSEALHINNPFSYPDSEVHRCQSCLTEYQVEHISQIVICVTVWKNLGSGRNPNDPKWRSHVRSASNNSNTTKGIYFKAGSIRDAWDGQK
ncbi:MAG: hypothetical protein MMC33_001527 [Icmadophila ericetorum]|nr:hypothetical protein [Icmadophila ericetorum]